MENDKCTQTLEKAKDVTYIPVTDKDKVNAISLLFKK